MVTREKQCIFGTEASKRKVKKHKKVKTIEAQVSSSAKLNKTKSKKKRFKLKDTDSVVQDLDIEQAESLQKCRKTENSTVVPTAKKAQKHKKKHKTKLSENTPIEKVTNGIDTGRGLKNDDTNDNGDLEIKDKQNTLQKVKKRKKKLKETVTEKSIETIETDCTRMETCGSKEISNSDPNTSKKRKKRRHSNVDCDKTSDAIDCAISIESKKATSKKKNKKSKHARHETQCSPNQQDIGGKSLKTTKIPQDQIKSDTQVNKGRTSLPSTTEANHIGQWSNASFEDKNAQEKFMRLMGGRKAQTSHNVGKLWSRPSQVSTTARSGVEFKSVSEDLENQYNAALSFNLQKRNEKNLSKGLGFAEDPAKGKKFYIDIKKSNSIKFED